MRYREETDAMGSVKVPADVYYGAQTQRALDNFNISGLFLPSEFLHGLALIKRYAAEVNGSLGLLEAQAAEAIVQAAGETIDGRFDDQFNLDVFQTGSGTSTNMNLNEVIAARANEIISGQKGGKSPVHPNDHVNLGQSSNDVIPTAIHIAARIALEKSLVPALKQLEKSLNQKTIQFEKVAKIGRTHLQDAVPITLGQEFSGFARQVSLGIARVEAVYERLSELALGGTAVGTGLNTHPDFAAKVIDLISRHTGIKFQEAQNHFEAQAAQDTGVETSGALKTIAVSLINIANDIRWLGSGPRAGLGEIRLPALQPGSSIMPGKVNPVICEAVIQAAYQVMGNDTTITLAGQNGNFQLNTALPLLAYNLLQSISILAKATQALAIKCIDGIKADEKKCAANIEKSLAMVTPLVPHIGYDRAAAIAHKAYESGQTIREIALQEKLLPPEKLDEILGESLS
jgi:fumarate hydratase, class II